MAIGPVSLRSASLEPTEPRAPSQAAWDKLTQDERMRVVMALPVAAPVDARPPEGDAYRKVKTGALQALEAFFRRLKQRVYVSSDLAIYYPNETRIVPELFVVLDAEPRDRTKWVVSAEGKGPDFVVEVFASPEAAKEREAHVDRYAALGISELFLLDRTRRWLRGYRLPRPTARAYEPIPLDEGRFSSNVLGLDIALEGPRLRFLYGTAPLPEADETISRLGAMLNEAVIMKEEAERRAVEEGRRALEAALRAQDAQKLAEEIKRRADDEGRRAEEQGERAAVLERKLAEALSELHKLKGWE
jgi:Uma2 family endonuclease